MLLINDDHAEIFEWRKERGTGADDDRRLAAFRLQPGGQPLAVVERRVQDFHRGVKPLAKAGDGLRRQADFRHHDQRLLAFGQHVFQYAEINFRFTRAGDAFQQPRGKFVGGAVNRANRGGLLGIQA